MTNWIKCSDRLPDTDANCRVFRTGINHTQEEPEFYKYEYSRWYKLNTGYDFGWSAEQNCPGLPITHWYYVPEPPETDK